MAERICPTCGRGILTRCGRKGPWEKFVLPLFGVFPWRCGRCRSRFRLSDRGIVDFRRLRRTGVQEDETLPAKDLGSPETSPPVPDTLAVARLEETAMSVELKSGRDA